MKIVTTAGDFVAALKASAFERGKNTIPILTNVEIHGNEVIGTDLDLFSVVNFEGENDMSSKSESFTINAKQAINALTGEKGELTIEYTPNVNATPDNQPLATLTINGIQFKVPTMDVKNFPELPTKAPYALTVDGDEFRKLLSRTFFAISSEESRYTLNGGRLIADEDTVKLVATDGHRLSLATTERAPKLRKGVQKGHLDTLIHRGALEWLKNNVNGSVSIGVSKTADMAKEQFHVWQTFVTGNKTLITRQLSGKFPDYNQVIPTDNTITGTIPSASKFASVLTRVAKCADERSGCVRFHFASKSEISATSTDAGTAIAPLDVSMACDIAVGFNSGFLLEFLKVVGDAPVTVHLKDARSAVLFTTEDNWQHILMPMRL